MLIYNLLKKRKFVIQKIKNKCTTTSPPKKNHELGRYCLIEMINQRQ